MGNACTKADTAVSTRDAIKYPDVHKPAADAKITGAIDWRREGIRHKRNEVYIDVLESVNLLMSSTGDVLRNEVTAQVQMNAKLTGMPECNFGLNDINSLLKRRRIRIGSPGSRLMTVHFTDVLDLESLTLIGQLHLSLRMENLN